MQTRRVYLSSPALLPAFRLLLCVLGMTHRKVSVGGRTLTLGLRLYKIFYLSFQHAYATMSSLKDQHIFFPLFLSMVDVASIIQPGMETAMGLCVPRK